MKQLGQIFSRTAAMLAIVSATGCAYMHVQSPLSTDFHKTELGTKTGRSNAYSVLWLFSWGDAGTKAAAKNGDIKVIDCADAETKIVLFGIYTRFTTVVYGD